MQPTLTSAYVCGRIVRRRPSCGHVDNATALPTGPQLAAAKPDLYRFKRRNSGGFRSTREGQLSGGWGRFHPRFLPTRLIVLLPSRASRCLIMRLKAREIFDLPFDGHWRRRSGFAERIYGLILFDPKWT